MSTRRSPSLKDVSYQSLKREQALHRSLRECTTRRLTHYNPCNVDHVHNAPTLTSRVQWTNGRGAPGKDTVHTVNDTIAVERDVSMSPVQSEVDELVQSDDDDQPPESSRPSTGMSSHLHPSSALRGNESVSDRSHSSPSHSDSSDTERRQPNFPGNRDIIDSHFLSTSPSPPTQHSAELETPSPVSDVGSYRNCWPSENGKPSSSLGLHLNTIDKPLLRRERLARVGSWRAESTVQDRLYNHNQGQYGVASAYDSPRSSYLHYSPSISSSSAPPSPPPVLPPIHHLNATLPVNTGNTPGVMHWRFRESSDPHQAKKFRSGRDYPDEYTDFRSATASPQSLPPLLPHIKMMAQPYPPPRPPPGIMPVVSVAPPMPSAATRTRDKNAWKDYAQLVTNENEETQFRCIWPTGYTGEVNDHCGYTAKRHLVKRHIETRHLQFKDHICPYCAKAFPQRVSLMIHVNRHTGAKPHSCRYVDCDKTFSDPARRHKHMVEAHGYNPQGPRKRHRTVDSYHTNKNFESLAPWTAKDEAIKDAVAKS
ncbi:hypothetical protein ACEPAI_5771 [Sanghuangporus weigelae]